LRRVTRLIDDPGPRGRLSIDAALALGDEWVFLEKFDGCAGRVKTSRTGQVVSVIGRNGQPLRGGAEELVGTYAGISDAILWSEITAHTECSIRERQRAGFVFARIWDATRLAGRSIAELGFEDRHSLIRDLHERDELADEWTIDASGRRHAIASGRFCGAASARRRFYVAPLMHNRERVRRFWQDYVETGTSEGLVACARSARIGARRAKAKVKPRDLLSATVTEIGRGVVVLRWSGGAFVASARFKGSEDLRVGSIYDVAHEGFYEAGATPRFARIVRARPDLGSN
jgi:hypothetical protein